MQCSRNIHTAFTAFITFLKCAPPVQRVWSLDSATAPFQWTSSVRRCAAIERPGCGHTHPLMAVMAVMVAQSLQTKTVDDNWSVLEDVERCWKVESKTAMQLWHTPRELLVEWCWIHRMLGWKAESSQEKGTMICICESVDPGVPEKCPYLCYIFPSFRLLEVVLGVRSPFQVLCCCDPLHDNRQNFQNVPFLSISYISLEPRLTTVELLWHQPRGSRVWLPSSPRPHPPHGDTSLGWCGNAPAHPGPGLQPRGSSKGWQEQLAPEMILRGSTVLETLKQIQIWVRRWAHLILVILPFWSNLRLSRYWWWDIEPSSIGVNHIEPPIPSTVHRENPVAFPTSQSWHTTAPADSWSSPVTSSGIPPNLFAVFRRSASVSRQKTLRQGTVNVGEAAKPNMRSSQIKMRSYQDLDAIGLLRLLHIQPRNMLVFNNSDEYCILRFHSIRPR